MLYDIYDTDDGAELLVSSVTATLPPGPALLAAPPRWLGDADLSGALVPGPLPGGLQPSGAYEFLFRNGYGAFITARGSEFSVCLGGDWLPSQDREEVFGLSCEEVTLFLQSVESLPAPEFTDLGEF